MKKLIACLLAVVLATLFVFCAMAEQSGTDYSWLDDMTINQLKELDVEIHKRIPYEGEQKPDIDASILVGHWERKIDSDISYKQTSPHYGHSMIVTIDVYEPGVGHYLKYDLSCDEKRVDLPFVYEMKDANTVLLDDSGTITAYTLGEDEEGLFLTKVGDDTIRYRKTSKE